MFSPNHSSTTKKEWSLLLCDHKRIKFCVWALNGFAGLHLQDVKALTEAAFIERKRNDVVVCLASFHNYVLVKLIWFLPSPFNSVTRAGRNQIMDVCSSASPLGEQLLAWLCWSDLHSGWSSWASPKVFAVYDFNSFCVQKLRCLRKEMLLCCSLHLWHLCHRGQHGAVPSVCLLTGAMEGLEFLITII